MTSELEKKFFDTFGIKKKELEYPDNFTYYPEITDRILLELICIYNQYSQPFSIYSEKKEFLRDDILELMINIFNYFYAHEMDKYSKLKHQVRTLFEEG